MRSVYKHGRTWGYLTCTVALCTQTYSSKMHKNVQIMQFCKMFIYQHFLTKRMHFAARMQVAASSARTRPASSSTGTISGRP